MDKFKTNEPDGIAPKPNGGRKYQDVLTPVKNMTGEADGCTQKVGCMPKSTEALSILGAGQPHKQRYK
jgi:hypothetical protein